MNINLFKNIRTTRFKTTIWYASLFLVLEILFGLIIYWYLFGSLNQKLDQSLTLQANAIYSFFNESKKNFDDFIPDSIYSAQEELVWDIIYEALVYNKKNTYVQILYNDKLIFKTANLYNIDLVLPEKQDAALRLFYLTEKRISDDLIRASLLNKDKYQILVAFPIENITDTLKSFTTIYFIFVPIFLLISLFGGFIISKKSLSRINFIIKQTEYITAQNLSGKIAGEEFTDEYGNLVRKMNEMIERIHKSVDYMNSFSISASHELKTPLTILRGEIEIALKTNKNIDEYRETLQSNYEETLRLTKIIDNLFFISKVDHSLIKLEKRKTIISEFLIEIIKGMGIFGKDKNISIFYHTEREYEIFLDQDLMRQALINLIENGIKYSFENSQIIVSTKINKAFLDITVSNEGAGIPQEAISKIFNRFYRLENSRNRSTGGVGLGLSVVKSIVELHNGTIGVYSELNKKTEFTILIPLDV